MTGAGPGRDRDRPQCGARKRQTPGNCARPAGWGTDHAGHGPCKLHGGSTRAHKVHALWRAVEADAKAVLAAEGLDGVDDPLGRIARLAVEALAFKGSTAQRVNALGDVRFTDDRGAEQLRAEVALYERALDRSVRFLEVLAKLGYEERQVRIAEAQGALLAEVIHDVLRAVRLTPEQAERAPEIVASRLRLLGSPT
jgi:hypothetical protein